MSRTILQGVTLSSGRVTDIAIDSTTTKIEGIGDIEVSHFDNIEDCKGMVALPAAVEPHAHLDKALLSEFGQNVRNHRGDLAGAIKVMKEIQITPEDVFKRAKTAVLEMVGNGTTLIRTHVDVREGVGIANIEPLLELKRWLANENLAELQVAGLIGSPITGRNGRIHRRLLQQAVEGGIDVIGGCPYLEEDSKGALEILMNSAHDAKKPLDLHTDETLDPDIFTLSELIDATEKRGIGAGITASHCVSLGVQELDRQWSVGTQLLELGISVIVLPQTNLYLQARNFTIAPPRGIAPISLLRKIGVTVAAGSDNARDPFCEMGRMDMLETASLLVMAAHLTPDEAWDACSLSGRKVLGHASDGLELGAVADIVLLEGPNFVSAIAKASARRIVIHRGRVSIRTNVDRQFA